MDTSLYIVATPIGNLGDMSPRAVEILRSVDVVLAEDTRVSAKLLNHFDIHTKLERCDENVIVSKTPSLIERMQSGEVFAFVSDAGTPGISDPGTTLVDAARNQNIDIEAIPGPSALIQALVLSGLGIDNFYFAGFAPRKKQAQIDYFEALRYYAGALVMYESPYRVSETLANLAQVFPDRIGVFAREFTKLHEEVIRDTLPQLALTVSERAQIKGEIVLVIDAPRREDNSLKSVQECYNDVKQTLGVNTITKEELVILKLKEGVKKSDIAKELVRNFDVNRDEAYNLILTISHDLL